MSCSTFQLKCECRRHKVAVLNKSALDAACELDALQTVAEISDDDRERIQGIVARVYDASEVVLLEERQQEVFDALQPQIAAKLINLTHRETIVARMCFEAGVRAGIPMLRAGEVQDDLPG